MALSSAMPQPGAEQILTPPVRYAWIIPGTPITELGL